MLSVFVEHEHREAAATWQMYRYRAQYSLDNDNGIEKSIQFFALSPDEIYGRKLTAQQLHATIAALPDKQTRRIYAHYIKCNKYLYNFCHLKMYNNCHNKHQ